MATKFLPWSRQPEAAATRAILYFSPARGKNRMCSHPRPGDATAEKLAEKNRENFNELNILRQNHRLCRQV